MQNYNNNLERSLSIEETYALAEIARRKTTSDQSRHRLRLRVGHVQILEALETVIRTSPPPSPRQPIMEASSLSSKHMSWSSLDAPQVCAPVEPLDGVDEYGFAYDDGEEDFDDLSLCRTESRRD